MNYGELRVQFMELLNRQDCSTSLADIFISMGVRRTERILRTPFQRRLITLTIGSDYTGNLTIPTDYLGLDWLKVNGRGIPRVSPNSDEKEIAHGHTPVFFIQNEKFLFRPELKTGDVVKINYYRETFIFEEDSDITPATIIIPDLVIYAALVFAADHFVDERRADFKEMFTSLHQEVQAQADLDAFSGGMVIQNPYEGMC